MIIKFKISNVYIYMHNRYNCIATMAKIGTEDKCYLRLLDAYDS